MAFVLSKEQLGCTICLDIFVKPVSIPCGHNFCLGCLKRFWDTRRKCECPLCKESFKIRPELKVNVGLRDIADMYRKYVSYFETMSCKISSILSVFDFLSEINQISIKSKGL